MIYENIIYFLSLTFDPEVLWLTAPLFISTLIILAYFGKYNDEKPGWNSLVANSLVLVFVSLALLKTIYSYESLGTINFILFQKETIFSFGILVLGMLILSLNFKHFLPEKLAEKISSPITLNLIAYIGILFVHSGEPDVSKLLLSPPSQNGMDIFLALAIIFLILFVSLNAIYSLFSKMFQNLKKIKEKEKVKNITEEKSKINKEKQEIKRKEKKLTKEELKKLEKQKKEAIKLKKIVNAPLTKKKKN